MIKFWIALTAGLLATTASAKDVQISGTACWTGTADLIAVSQADWGMNWRLSGTYTDENDPAESSYFECLGHGEMNAGVAKPNIYNCILYFADGSTMLETATGSDGGSKSTYVGGTGRHEGVSGGGSGTQIVYVGKPPQGSFAGCRKVTGTKTLK